MERRFSRWLEQHGYLEEDDQDEEALDGWFGPAAYDTVQGHRPPAKPRDPNRFQVHARVRVRAGDRPGRERLCTYVARPPVAEAQIEPLDEDRVRLWLRNPGRSLASSVVLTSMQLIRRLAWQVPPPNLHLVRYAGILAPAARLRQRVVPAGRVAIKAAWFGERKFEPLVPVPSRTAWARLLAKVYEIHAHQCPRCHAPMRPIAAVLPPQARAWIEQGRILPMPSTGPPALVSRQLDLPLVA
ncbi:MAG: transposase [Deltaproteobacteria bacterium]